IYVVNNGKSRFFARELQALHALNRWQPQQEVIERRKIGQMGQVDYSGGRGNHNGNEFYRCFIKTVLGQPVLSRLFSINADRCLPVYFDFVLGYINRWL